MKKLDISTVKHPETYARVDDIDYEWAKLFKWTAEERPTGMYAVRRFKGSTVRLHREVVRARAHEQVDHRDGDGLNNLRSNLRICNNGENQQNRIKHQRL